MVHTKGRGRSYSILFSLFTLGRGLFSGCPVTIWAQIHHHMPRELKKMLLRFSSSWRPSVPMWYRENSNFGLWILPKRSLYSGQGDSEQRQSNDDPSQSLKWKTQVHWKVDSIIVCWSGSTQPGSGPGSTVWAKMIVNEIQIPSLNRSFN